MTEETKKQKLLLIKLSSLGDVIFNIPLANALRNAGYEVTWIVSEKGYDVIKDNSCVDKVILAPFVKWKKEKSFIKRVKEFFEIKRQIKEYKFDIAIDTQGLLKSFGFMFNTGIKRRIVGTNAREFSILGGNEFVKFPKIPDWHTPIVKQYLKFARHLGVETDKIQVTLPNTSEETVKRIDELLNDTDKTKPLAVVCPATTWDNKFWDKDNWKQLIQKIEDKYCIVFTGTQNDIDYIEYINNGKHLNLAGKTNLKELIELFRRTDLVLSLDSGSTHLAWATQKPKIVSIFCCTPPTLYGPIGEKYISLSGHLPCQPCHNRKCHKLAEEYNACTKYPTVEEVINAIDELSKR